MSENAEPQKLQRMASGRYFLAATAVYDNMGSQPREEVSPAEIRLGWIFRLRASQRAERFLPLSQEELELWKPRQRELAEIRDTIRYFASIEHGGEAFWGSLNHTEIQVSRS